MGDGSGGSGGAIVLSTGNICVCHAPQIPTIPDLANSRLGKKWTEYIDKEWLRELEQKEKKVGNLLE